MSNLALVEHSPLSDVLDSVDEGLRQDTLARAQAALAIQEQAAQAEAAANAAAEAAVAAADAQLEQDMKAARAACVAMVGRSHADAWACVVRAIKRDDRDPEAPRPEDVMTAINIGEQLIALHTGRKFAVEGCFLSEGDPAALARTAAVAKVMGG